jgi:DNA repair protein RadC
MKNYKTNSEILTISEVKICYKPKIKPSERPVISCSKDIYRLLTKNCIFDPATMEHREFFKLLLLNRANKLLGVTYLSEGSTSGVGVDVRHIMQAAILANAAGIILCHNHPSGNLQPSAADDRITLKIKKACELMDISLTDHLVISSEGYYSYADEGKI